MSAPPSPSGDTADRPGPPWVLIGLVAVLLALRLVVGGALPLTEDEAYYRLWARAPALGYYDHPPMIAWWIWLGVRVCGDTALGVRLLPILGGALMSVLVFDTARLAGADRPTRARAGIWYNATLLVAAGDMLAVPDVPAAFFWLLCLWSVFRARRGGGLGWWLAAGAAAGLATLSKYSALFLGPGVLLWLAWTPAGRATLRTPGPWLALLVAASLFGVNLGWNATHHWLTFARQFGRIAPHRLTLRYPPEFVATQVLLLNPLIALFLARRGVGRAAPLILTSLPLVGYLLLHSLHDRIQAHWPAPVYPSLAIAAAFAAEGGGRFWRAARIAVPWLGLGLCVAAGLYLALPLAGVTLMFDPATPLRDWRRFDARIETLRRATGAAWVGTTSYGLAARLMDAPSIDASVIQLSERDRWQGLADGARADVSRPGLLVDLARRIDRASLAACFSAVQPLGEIDRGPAGERPKRYVAYLLSGPRRDVLRLGCGGDADRRAAPGLSRAGGGPRARDGAGPASWAGPRG